MEIDKVMNNRWGVSGVEGIDCNKITSNQGNIYHQQQKPLTLARRFYLAEYCLRFGKPAEAPQFSPPEQ